MNSKILRTHAWGDMFRRLFPPLAFAVVSGLGLTATARAERVRVTIHGQYEYTGANASPTADFTLSFTLDRQPPVCGGGLGVSIVCGVSRPVYDNGGLHAVLGDPTLQLRDAARKGGLALYQQDVQLNRLGFDIGSSQLWSGNLDNPTLVDGTYDICAAHFGQVHPEYMGEMCSYAEQGFASGDPITNPFFDPITYQSDDPILSGTITIAAEAPPPPSLALTATAGTLQLRWPETPGFSLEETTDLTIGSWSAVTNTPTLNENINSLTLSMEGPARFFRLRKP